MDQKMRSHLNFSLIVDSGRKGACEAAAAAAADTASSAALPARSANLEIHGSDHGSLSYSFDNNQKVATD